MRKVLQSFSVQDILKVKMQKMTLEAKPVIKNKFWVVEDQGHQVATIQATPEGVVFVKDNHREKFSNIKVLSNKYNIHVGKNSRQNPAVTHEYNIYGFPTGHKPHNGLYDVRRRLPFFTKTAKSKSFYCAGYYAIKINDEWTEQFCPKSIVVRRYPYFGPYRSSVEAQQAITKAVNCA